MYINHARPNIKYQIYRPNIKSGVIVNVLKGLYIIKNKIKMEAYKLLDNKSF